MCPLTILYLLLRLRSVLLHYLWFIFLSTMATLVLQSKLHRASISSQMKGFRLEPQPHGPSRLWAKYHLQQERSLSQQWFDYFYKKKYYGHHWLLCATIVLPVFTLWPCGSVGVTIFQLIDHVGDKILSYIQSNTGVAVVSKAPVKTFKLRPWQPCLLLGIETSISERLTMKLVTGGRWLG